MALDTPEPPTIESVVLELLDIVEALAARVVVLEGR